MDLWILIGLIYVVTTAIVIIATLKGKPLSRFLGERRLCKILEAILWPAFQAFVLVMLCLMAILIFALFLEIASEIIIDLSKMGFKKLRLLTTMPKKPA